ncbi:MAG: 3-deoxy-manno-octulosonate cytidylyltransferase [Desulfobacterales bacterium]|nr:3-deoxy-manno-octulosonate cytidylyltransferase [Desulfobacterales bacterium]
MKIIAIIPARYRSTRFEGKPLVNILGKSMIQRVYEGVSQSRLIEQVLVATDDQRIFKEVHRFGGKAVMTSSSHRTGTDRIAEVARKKKAEIIVNVQGDEPLIKGEIIDKAIRPMVRDKTLPMSTLVTPLEDMEEWLNPNVVKVTVDQDGFALYFSRSPIPFPQGFNLEAAFRPSSEMENIHPQKAFRHIGLYVYRRNFLLRYARMKPSPLEEIEKLEQLRVLENGYRIRVAVVEYKPFHVDTPQDLPKILSFLAQPS